MNQQEFNQLRQSAEATLRREVKAIMSASRENVLHRDAGEARVDNDDLAAFLSREMNNFSTAITLEQKIDKVNDTFKRFAEENGLKYEPIPYRPVKEYEPQ